MLRSRRFHVQWQVKMAIVLLLFSGLLWWTVLYVNDELRPTIEQIADKETARIATDVINEAIKQEMAKRPLEPFFHIVRDERGKVATVDFDAIVMNRLLTQLTDAVQFYLHEAERGKLALPSGDPPGKSMKEEEQGIVYYIPFGQITNNTLLGNLGPRIPVRFFLLGDVDSELKRTIKSYGINNVLIEIFVHVKVVVQVVIPFMSKVTPVSASVPIVMKVIQGEVPQIVDKAKWFPATDEQVKENNE